MCISASPAPPQTAKGADNTPGADHAAAGRKRAAPTKHQAPSTQTAGLTVENDARQLAFAAPEGLRDRQCTWLTDAVPCRTRIPNRQRPSKRTIPLPMALSTHPFANGDRVQWTCDSIGYATAFAKTISSSTGNPVAKTSVTTSPSITPRPTIKQCAPHISLKPLFALQIALQVVCEGVLILA